MILNKIENVMIDKYAFDSQVSANLSVEPVNSIEFRFQQRCKSRKHYE